MLLISTTGKRSAQHGVGGQAGFPPLTRKTCEARSTAKPCVGGQAGFPPLTRKT